MCAYYALLIAVSEMGAGRAAGARKGGAQEGGTC